MSAFEVSDVLCDSVVKTSIFRADELRLVSQNGLV